MVQRQFLGKLTPRPELEQVPDVKAKAPNERARQPVTMSNPNAFPEEQPDGPPTTFHHGTTAECAHPTLNAGGPCQVKTATPRANATSRGAPDQRRFTSPNTEGTRPEASVPQRIAPTTFHVAPTRWNLRLPRQNWCATTGTGTTCLRHPESRGTTCRASARRLSTGIDVSSRITRRFTTPKRVERPPNMESSLLLVWKDRCYIFYILQRPDLGKFSKSHETCFPLHICNSNYIPALFQPYSGQFQIRIWPEYGWNRDRAGIWLFRITHEPVAAQ